MRRRGHGEGSIYRRSDNGLWAGTLNLGWREGKRVRRSFYGKTRREVQDKLEAARQAAAAGVEPTGQRLTIERYLGDWLEASRTSIRYSTWRRYEQIVRCQLVPHLGHHQLSRLTPGHVEAMMRAVRAEGHSIRTVLHCRAVLRSALSRAARHGLILRNAAALADPPHAPQREVKALDPDDVRTLLTAIQDDPFGPLYVLAIASGLRQGELLGLKWSDIDFDGGTVAVRRALQRVEGKLITVEPKTARSRRDVSLPAVAVEALRDHRRRQLAGSVQSAVGYVFTDEAGRPLHGPAVTRRFQTRLDAAGLARVPFHALRHTAASLLLAKGVHPRVVMEMLGHSTIALTMNTYSHVIPALQRDAAEQMNGMLTG